MGEDQCKLGRWVMIPVSLTHSSIRPPTISGTAQRKTSQRLYPSEPAQSGAASAGSPLKLQDTKYLQATGYCTSMCTAGWHRHRPFPTQLPKSKLAVLDPCTTGTSQLPRTSHQLSAVAKPTSLAKSSLETSSRRAIQPNTKPRPSSPLELVPSQCLPRRICVART